MPPEMIATEKYKKLPAGSTFICSSSSAKALSALGMANYHNAASVPVMTREMSAGPEFTSQSGTQIASVLSVPAAAILSESGAVAEAELSNPVVSDDNSAKDDVPAGEVLAPVEASAPEAASAPAPVTGSVSVSTDDASVAVNKPTKQYSQGNQYSNKKSDSGNQKSSVAAKNSPYKK